MRLFSFSKRDTAPDEHAQNPGETSAPPSAINTSAPPSSVSVASATRDAAASNAREALKRKRGRPSAADAGAPVVTDRALQEKINGQIALQLEALHEPKLWSSLLCMPAAGMHAITGKERWEFSKEERDTIGLSGSALAQTMMITNPRALAAFMFISIMSTAYLPRAIGELKDLTDKRKAEAKKKEQAPDANIAKS